MSAQVQAQTIPTMRTAKLPRLDWRTMVTGETDKLSSDDVGAMDAYFREFIQVDFTAEERRCPCCQSSFGKNGLVGFLMSGAPNHATLEWGLANGEAFCSHCQYPFRVYHRQVGPIKFLNVALPYHPDGLESEDNDDDEPMRIPCGSCGRLTVRDTTYGDLCYRCIRADNE